jgi:hypothetical protein
MTDQTGEDKKNKKGFFARLIEKLDGKLEKASEKKGCCCNSNEDKDSSCC